MTTSSRAVRILPTVTAGLAAVLIPTTWAAANPHPGPRAADDKPTVITVHWTVTAHTLDTAPKGLSSGDTLQARFTFTATPTGSADFACTAVQTRYLCTGIIRLHDGDLYVATGPVNPQQPATVQGGTRAYLGAHGQFIQREHPDGSGSWTITLDH